MYRVGNQPFGKHLIIKPFGESYVKNNHTR
jgi:hypothetical protein